MKPGHNHPETFKRFKKGVVTIKHKDVLCYASATVTDKAKGDQHSNWEGFKKGHGIQKYQATDLYFETDVPPGPCRYPAFEKFVMAPSLYDYQLVLVDKHKVKKSPRLVCPKTSSWSFCTAVNITMSSRFSQGSLQQLISVITV